MLCFFRVLSDWILPTAADFVAAVSDGGYFHNCANCITVCPPLYLMFILWVLGVNIRYVMCLFVVMSAVTGWTHVIGVTALLG